MPDADGTEGDPPPPPVMEIIGVTVDTGADAVVALVRATAV